MSTTAASSAPVADKNVEPRKESRSVLKGIFGFFVWSFVTVRTIIRGLLPQDANHLAMRTSNMATYIYVSAWTFVVAVIFMRVCTLAVATWSMVVLAIVQLVVASALAYWVGKTRTPINDGDPERD